jgi:hypothetical protein
MTRYRPALIALGIAVGLWVFGYLVDFDIFR